tara:strand:+ start:215 stop:640 length:426 start_codon:yes stop_codon:yes gene_type:complete
MSFQPSQRSDQQTDEGIYADRAARFSDLLQNKPEPGRTLQSEDKNPVQVHVQRKEPAGTYVMFVNAVVDDAGTGWFLKDGLVGLKCLITPSSQQDLLKNFETISDMSVVALRVVRQNQKGTALICEVMLIGDSYDGTDVLA